MTKVKKGPRSAPSSTEARKPCWNVDEAELIPVSVTDQQFKKMLAEVGKLIYIDIHNQLQKKNLSIASESNGHNKKCDGQDEAA